MRFSLVAVAASILSVVMAQEAYPTVPVATTVWTAGKNVTVEWKLTNASDKTAMSIDLFKGDPTHQTLVKSYGSAPSGATKFKIALASSLGADYYSIRIGDSYSHYFTIKSSSGASPTGAMPTVGSTNATTTVAATTASSATTKPAATTTAAGNSTTAGKATSGANMMAAGPMAVAAALVAAAMAL
ncbi:hypothetical protein BGZ79_007002 [Entomortierella chlamydospora]|nr:hypothetical protein BGZ79_007002 [Entomortierella chlamydospora]